MSAANETKLDPKMRRVRPWVAALFSFFFWGVGPYYAGKTRIAYLMASALLALPLCLVGVLLVVMANGGGGRWMLPEEGSISVSDLVSFLFGLGAAIVAFVIASREQATVRRGKSALGVYVLLALAPILVAVLIAFSLRSAFYHPFNMPSASMSPTLDIGDYFVVDKRAYGYSSHSTAPLKGLLSKGRKATTHIQRGDIVVFRNDKDFGRSYVSRILGLPGDTISFKNGVAILNGVPISRIREENGSPEEDGAIFRETLPSGASYLTRDMGFGPLDDVGPYRVPENHYFMVSDNRDRAQDSRVLSMVGFVPLDNVLGPVMPARTLD